MSKFRFDRDELPAPPAAAVDYLAKLAGDQPDRQGSIQSRRVGLLAAVLPVDYRLNPSGEAFLALVKTLSSKRITLLHTRAVACGSAVVEVGTYPLDRIQLLCQVTSCQPSGRFYEIEAILVNRITD